MIKTFQEFLNESISLSDLKSQIALSAQKIYDEWSQDENGNDEVLGTGGICQDIAFEICNIISDNDIECQTVSQSIGDQHVYVVAKTDDGVFSIDIPPYVYEQGGGYNWRKIPDVKFDFTDVIIKRLSPNPEDFYQYTESE